MTDIDHFISSLADSATPVRPVAHPFATCIAWLMVAGFYLGFMLMITGVREDIALKLQVPLFTSEISSLCTLLATTLVATSLLAFPDMHQKRWLLTLPMVPLCTFVATLAMEYVADVPPAPQPEHSYMCLLCIALYSTVPATGIMLFLKTRATTYPKISGAVALISATSLGCLVLRLSEQTDSISHLIQWHYIPMIGFALLGVWLGKWLLKW